MWWWHCEERLPPYECQFHQTTKSSPVSPDYQVFTSFTRLPSLHQFHQITKSSPVSSDNQVFTSFTRLPSFHQCHQTIKFSPVSPDNQVFTSFTRLPNHKTFDYNTSCVAMRHHYFLWLRLLTLHLVNKEDQLLMKQMSNLLKRRTVYIYIYIYTL